MVTASHNPEPDNGAKLVRRDPPRLAICLARRSVVTHARGCRPCRDQVDPLGEMLEESWEPLAARLANCNDDDVFAVLKVRARGCVLRSLALGVSLLLPLRPKFFPTRVIAARLLFPRQRLVPCLPPDPGNCRGGAGAARRPRQGGGGPRHAPQWPCARRRAQGRLRVSASLFKPRRFVVRPFYNFRVHIPYRVRLSSPPSGRWAQK